MQKLFTLIFGLALISSTVSARIPDVLIDDPHFLKNKQFEFKSSHHESCKHKYHEALFSKEESAIVWRPYDVLKYKLHVDLYKVFTESSLDNYFLNYNGIQEITVALSDSYENVIELDAAKMIIDSIKVDGALLTNYEQLGSILSINTESLEIEENQLTLAIYYTYTGNGRDGFYFYKEGENIVADRYVDYDLVYTQSEPTHARNWMPCNDNPHDKALADISIAVPKGITAVSNGLLTEKEELEEKDIFHYSHAYPVTTYLMVFNASTFASYTETYTKDDGNGDEVPVSYYVFPEDVEGGIYDAKESFKNTVWMMEYYSDLFIEYPFESYGVVAVDPYGFGGMEHQTMTTIKRTLVTPSYEYVSAHELAHHWLGDMITCATWNDIWINEGGATWSEQLWYLEKDGQMKYYQDLLQNKFAYLQSGGLDLPAIYGLPSNTLFGQYSRLVYEKSGWVYHMLYNMLGEEEFWPIFRSLLEKYKYQSLETKDFIAHFKEHAVDPAIDIDTFFDQWLFNAGHPVVEIIPEYEALDGGKWRVKARVIQKQSGKNIPELFEIPVDFVIFKTDDDYSYIRKWMYTKDEMYDLGEFDYKPSRVSLSSRFVLWEVEEIPSSVEEYKGSVANTSIFPNPANLGEESVLRFSNDNYQNVKVDIYDQLGRHIANLHDASLNQGSYDISINTNNLHSGNYIVVINKDGMSQALNFVVVK